MSTKGNESLAQHHKEKVGGAVVAEVLNAIRFTPVKDSCDEECGTLFEQVLQVDPKGQIPDAAKESMFEIQCKLTQVIIDRCRQIVKK